MLSLHRCDEILLNQLTQRLNFEAIFGHMNEKINTLHTMIKDGNY